MNDKGRCEGWGFYLSLPPGNSHFVIFNNNFCLDGMLWVKWINKLAKSYIHGECQMTDEHNRALSWESTLNYKVPGTQFAIAPHMHCLAPAHEANPSCSDPHILIAWSGTCYSLVCTRSRDNHFVVIIVGRVDCNAALTWSNRFDQLLARQLDESLYGQTVDSTGWNDSWMDVYSTRLLMQPLNQLSARQLYEHQSMWQSTYNSAPGYL